MIHIPLLIERKREGAELAESEIRELIEGFTAGTVPDYQVSALAMAIFFRGMTPEETFALTRAMMESGRTLQYPAGSPPKVDKHSTGGIGDKISLILAPLLACDELWVPMIAGRGLGITGGTLDKLESIPGFNVKVSEEQAMRQLDRLGVVMMGQTADICPADKKFYALRDVTGTVPSRPLIVASIMSKKLAENLDRLVLDVKFGRGAFMKTREDAALLAEQLSSVASSMGVETTFLLTPMEEPFGETVGNALEVIESVDCLQGGGPADLRELTLDLCCKVSRQPREQLAKWLDDGTAWKKFVELVEAQGGDATVLEKLGTVHAAPVIRPLVSPSSGTIRRMDAGAIGSSCVELGAGRQKSDDQVDPRAGCSGIRKVGSAIEKGEPLLQIHARTEADAEAAAAKMLRGIEVH